MTQVFSKDGDMVAVTIIELPPATIMAVKTKDKDGYQAIKIASGQVKEKKLNKAAQGAFKKAGIAAGKWVMEFRLKDVSEWEVGKQYDVSIFAEEKEITVIGTSKGRGFAGTIKKYKFQRGPSTHGSKNVRAPGSVGAHTYPARTFPGKKLPGHMGDVRKTVKNLRLVQVDVEKNLLYVRGAVPGATNGKVIVRKQ
jgi:large subunit ribosomal protein L3